MFKLGNNRKLGPLVHTWSLPVLHTCPGKSEVCKHVCYAKTGFLAYPSIKKAYRKNLAASRRDDFVDRAVFYLRELLVSRLRIHVSGDFYSNDYIDKWRSIIRRCRSVQFLAYTRSWNDSSLRANILRLGREPNLSLWLSSDASMPRPPRTKLPVCYLSVSDEDQPAFKVDLVFRHRRRTILKRTYNGGVVCPVENGVTKTTCSQCTICWQGSNFKQKAKPAITAPDKVGKTGRVGAGLPALSLALSSCRKAGS